LELSRAGLACRPYTKGNSSPRISVNLHKKIWQWAALTRSAVRRLGGTRLSTVGKGTSYWVFAICGGTP
jgi:hypothetical protein